MKNYSSSLLLLAARKLRYCQRRYIFFWSFICHQHFKQIKIATEIAQTNRRRTRVQLSRGEFQNNAVVRFRSGSNWPLNKQKKRFLSACLWRHTTTLLPSTVHDSIASSPGFTITFSEMDFIDAPSGILFREEEVSL